MQQRDIIIFYFCLALVAGGYYYWYQTRHVETCSIERTPTDSAETIILRLDDVQAYYLTELSMRMMRDANERNLPIVAGAIASGLPSDTTLVEFLHTHSCGIEVALHGYDHVPEFVGNTEHGEFAFLNITEATERTERALAVFKEAALPQPTTFIPPYNEVSENAQEVLTHYGLAVTSSLGKGVYDVDTATWDYLENKFTNARDVIEACQIDIANGEAPCVIMLHPQDFIKADRTIDEVRYLEYLALLDTFSDERYVVTRFDWHYQDHQSVKP